MARPQDFTSYVNLSEFFIDLLNSWNDPRLPVFATQVEQEDGTKAYVGLPSGYLTLPAITASLPNQSMAKAPMELTLMSYAEVEFIKAELFQKGILPGGATEAETAILEQKRIRRFNLRRCAFAAIFLCAASSVFAQVYPETSYKLSDDKTVLESWKGDETDIDMNSDANLKGVNEIADYAFDGNTNVKSVVIGENVKTIGAGAFLDCTSLEKVVMPDGLEAIGRAGFSSCTELKDVVLPTSLKSMGNSVFYNCAAIDKIIIPAEVTSVPDGAFNSCYSLSSVTFGDKVETIGEEAFKLCSSLTEISFPVSLKEIGTNAFVECI